MKVSALTQIHNRVDLFYETVASVLSQSHPVHELIVIDDGSTEDVQAALATFNDPRIKYFRYERVGVISKLRNIGMSKAEGDVIAFIDSDDVWHADKIRYHVADMLANDSVVSFSDCRLFNTEGWMGGPVCDGMDKGQVNIFKELTERNQSLAFGTNLFFKKAPEGTLLRFDERLFIGEHDFILLLSARYKTSYVDQVLNYIRRHNRNISNVKILEIVSPLEYNRTIKKLLDEKFISKQLHDRIKAANYSKVGYAYLTMKRYKKSIVFLSAAVVLDPQWKYIKVLMKALLHVQ